MELGFESKPMDSGHCSINVGPCYADSRPGSLKGGTGIRVQKAGCWVSLPGYQGPILMSQSARL